MKIRTKIMISAACFAILPMVIYTVFASMFVGKNGDAQFHAEITDLVNNQAATLQTYLDAVHNDISTLSSAPCVVEAGANSRAVSDAGDLLTRFSEENASVTAAQLRQGNKRQGHGHGA